MANPAAVTAQRDWSAGEIDPSVKRDDADPLFKAGARQMSNVRLLNSKKPQNRPGRRALFLPGTGTRVDQVQVNPTTFYYLAFGGDGSLYIRDSTGAAVAIRGAGSYPWGVGTVKNIVWDAFKIGVSQVDVIICYPGMKPAIASFDGTSTWTFSTFAFQTGADGVEQVPFFRIASPGITMLPNGLTGSVTATFSAPVLNANHVGAIFRFCNKRLRCTAFTNSTTGTFTCLEKLNGSQRLQMNSPPSITQLYAVGDIVTGSSTGCTGIVVALDPTFVTVQITNLLSGFVGGEALISSKSHDLIVNVAAIGNPAAVTIWDEQIVSDARGWPQSVFVDQFRLGFCDLPNTPSAILWSAFNQAYDFDVGSALPDDAIVELAPDRCRVYYTVPGPESSEFVFTDRGVYYIPVTASNPLKPGSVSFQRICRDACAQVKPVAVAEVLVFITLGGNNIMAVATPGATNRPYITQPLNDNRAHLFNSPVAIAGPTATGQFQEDYVYILNGDGTIAVGKYDVKNGMVDGIVGWVPWSGGGTVGWLSALNSTVLFTGTYAPNGISPVTLTESLDATLYLDAAMPYNSVPAALTPPLGKGPLWWLAGGTVDLMDGAAGTRMMGTYAIDANGFLVPQNNAGEDLTSVNLLAGQTWTATIEPFVPAVQPGQDVGQRMWPRRIKRAQVYVQNSSGFVMQRLYGDQTGPNLPAPGTVMKSRRIATWNQDEDPTQPPTLREQSYLDRPLGRFHDPRWAIVKDTPGPLLILEVGFEVTA